MADSITVRNHLFSLVNTSRVSKDLKSSVLKFIAFIDGEVVDMALSMVPDKVEPVRSALNNDIVKAKDQQKRELTSMKRQVDLAKDSEDSSKGIGLIKRAES